MTIRGYEEEAMTPASSMTEKAIEQRSECRHGLLGRRGTEIDERPRSEPPGCWPPADRCQNGTGRAGRSWPGKPSPDGGYTPAPRVAADVKEGPHEGTPKVD